MKKILYSVAFVGVAVSLSGCGATAYREGASTSPGAIVTQPTSSPTPTPTSTSTSSLQPAYDFAFKVGGISDNTRATYTATVTTNSTLKVRVTAPSTQILVGSKDGSYSNYSFIMGCAQFKVTVNGRSVLTNLIKVANVPFATPCDSSPTYQDIDFSDRLGGTGSVSIVVSEAQYDWRCYAQNGWSPGYCAMTQLFEATDHNTWHQINGALKIQTNDTAPL